MKSNTNLYNQALLSINGQGSLTNKSDKQNQLELNIYVINSACATLKNLSLFEQKNNRMRIIKHNGLTWTQIW